MKLTPLDIKVIVLISVRGASFPEAYQKVYGREPSQEMLDQYEKITQALS